MVDKVWNDDIADWSEAGQDEDGDDNQRCADDPRDDCEPASLLR